ncbi:ABC-three component system middle component 8 [Roseiconus lacunae]|uniref:ABC-three component system middle component 8 n=1 Tax=Roseiconus lacunae TaxID=2605694 RepID=UPI001E409E35|nr:ABC-three component system middle component 8 [Roseiconus lacunae]MCD0458618.1 hypothetical protein [Roseiconus lacunae]
MIQPNKHAHPDKTLLAVTSSLLRQLRSKRTLQFDELRQHLAKSHPEATSLFLPAIDLLFILGVVVYRKQNDSFEYTGQ